jgi:transcriptional regulator with XRE-family HTH domain
MEETLGKRIVANRKRVGLTQDQLAEKLGVTAQAVSKWENDQSCPDIGILPQLAEIFGVTTDALLGREEPAKVAEVVSEEENKNKFEFHWDDGRRHGLKFAFYVLVVGVLYLLSQLLSWGMSFWDVLWPTSILMFGLTNLWPEFSFFSTGCVLLGGYFLVQRWLPLPENIDSGVIWAVLIVLFGISLLADALRKPKKPKYRVHYNGNKGKTVRNLVVEGDRFQYDGSFSDDTALISIDTLGGGEADCSFGNYVLDLSGVNHVTENCNVELDCSFGRLIVLIPRRFAAVIDEDSSFASVETAGRPDDDPLGCIRLACDCSFGSITIKYI